MKTIRLSAAVMDFDTSQITVADEIIIDDSMFPDRIFLGMYANRERTQLNLFSHLTRGQATALFAELGDKLGLPYSLDTEPLDNPRVTSGARKVHR